MTQEQKILAVLESSDGKQLGPSLSLPVDITPQQLELLINQLLNNNEKHPFSFFVNDLEIINNLKADILEPLKKSTEDSLTIIYHPQSLFRVQPVTRCSSTLAGHSEAILCVHFSPDGTKAASGSGDTTVRIWDLTTETPINTCTAHSNWVLCIAWSPDGKVLASGGMDNMIYLWEGKTGKQIGCLKGHSKWITSLVWEPFLLNPNCHRLCSSSKDGTARIWNVVYQKQEFVLSQHKDAVSCTKWGGNGFIYTASRDKTIKIWNASNGQLFSSLTGHAHWINSLTLSTDYALRCGPFNHEGKMPADLEKAVQFAKELYERVLNSKNERLVSASDDFTLILWDPFTDKKPVARLVGHQQLVNHVAFSPDGRYIASASFDKSIKIWNAQSGKYITSLRSHVSHVYQIAFSSDSRLLLSSSKDSTLKLWDMKTFKLKADLPGHSDAVYAVDWSPSMESRAISGGKDRMIKFWRQ